MRKKTIPGVLLILFLLPGCVVTEKVYLTEVEVAGPVALPPVIPAMEQAEASAVTIVPHFGVNMDQKIVGRVTPVGTTPRWGGKDNLIWRVPRSEGGLDLQVAVAPSVALLV